MELVRPKPRGADISPPSADWRKDVIVYLANEAEAYFAVLETEIRRLKGERDRLKSLLIDAGLAAGGHILDSVSVEFLEHIPEEIRLALSASRADALKECAQIADERKAYLYGDVAEDELTSHDKSYGYALDWYKRAILARMEKAS